MSSGNSETEFQNKQSGLLAAISAQMAVFFKTDGTFDQKDDPRKEAILTLAYVALILSIGATISSLILTDKFADIPIRAARSQFCLESKSPNTNPENRIEEPYSTSNWGLLRIFGLGRSARFTLCHCKSQD